MLLSFTPLFPVSCLTTASPVAFPIVIVYLSASVSSSVAVSCSVGFSSAGFVTFCVVFSVAGFVTFCVVFSSAGFVTFSVGLSIIFSVDSATVSATVTLSFFAFLPHPVVVPTSNTAAIARHKKRFPLFFSFCIFSA